MNKMMTRRKLLQFGASMGLGSMLAACGGENAQAESASTSASSGGSTVTTPENTLTTWRMPDEAEPHIATWMAFVANANVWGSDLVNPVKNTLATIANTIVQFEPVNMLVNASDYTLAKQKLDPRVTLHIAEIDDLWIRDTGPVFVKNSRDEQAGVNFNFNGWGKKQSYQRDASIAKKVCELSGRTQLNTSLVLEGGGIEVDGHGTAIITESCVLNPNRNPGLSKAACEAELKRLLGIQKVIWLPGIVGKDITDGHTDFYARFASSGVVIAGLEHDPASYDYALTRRHLEILKSATDANGKAFKVLVLDAPSKVRPEYESKEFAAGYINFYVVNNAVIMPQFGDVETDALAKATLEKAFPNRRVIALNIDPISAGGGGIHCATQQQ
ncbi:agmatine deiminase family protein [Undibacterium sp. Di24W]|uniref:agmatine deiminase family protein n=1 Tax=Undibacterium sp. Di24W TaxID=3413033 RepID=UPI003BF14A82